jgi:hypothetical protein
MPCFSLLRSDHHVHEQKSFNTINKASVLPHFSLIFMILSRIKLILPIQPEEERSIYLIQSSSSLYTCAAHRLLTDTLRV